MNKNSMLRHPYYLESSSEWDKWRLCYQGGDAFKNTYLKQFSKRESVEDFEFRKSISYIPAFAKVAINEIKNSIFQRMVDITRTGGPKSYMDVVSGLNRGVDRCGSSMNSFIGFKVLPELLVMGSVGIFVDKKPKRGPSIADNIGLRPYLYVYPVESIYSWEYDEDGEDLSSLLLKDSDYQYDGETGFPISFVDSVRHFYKEDGLVHMRVYHQDSSLDTHEILDIPKIPFVFANLSSSLMRDIADYQISLMNLASSDMAYVTRANFPFYVEQYNPGEGFSSLNQRSGFQTEDGTDGSEASAQMSQDPKEISVGTITGRMVPKGVNMPEFIHPSSEPMQISMAKQEQLKSEIRLMLSLTIMNLKPVQASQESKMTDDRSLENGLSYIGLELEFMERNIGYLWSLYEHEDPPLIFYPESYQLKTDADRRQDTEKLINLLPYVPSLTGKKEIAKKAMKTLLENKVSTEVLFKVYREIDNAPNIISDPVLLTEDIANGLVDPSTASEMRGYPKGTADKAEEFNIRKAKELALAQSEAKATPQDNPGKNQDGNDLGARGVTGVSTNLRASKDEKKGKQKRGSGRMNKGGTDGGR